MTISKAKKLVEECGLNIEHPLHEKVLNIVVNALDKQTPTKVTHEASLYKCCTCPTCKNVIDEFTEFAGKRVRVTVQHCKFCGQALDWGETE